MLVPSTLTGWYKKTMMTSARPMAIRRSRVQTRISCRRECGDTGRSEVTMGDAAGAVASSDAVVVNCFSSELSIFPLPYIYSMFVATRARCDLWSIGLGAAEATVVLFTFCLIRLR